jgi:argininosuccinate lyase
VRPLLELNNISYSYHTIDGETKALSDISFQLAPGEFAAVVGPSGCGKSTLLSLIAGLIEAENGTIFLDGEPSEKSFRKSAKIGYMLQHDHLFEWRSILKNVLLGAEINKSVSQETKQRAKELLRQYGLKRFINSRPSELSGGMRQRAALIRTLMPNPELLLLDEPFSALDYQTRLTVSDDIGKIIKHSGKTALLVTHDLSEAISLADRIIILTKEEKDQIIEGLESICRDVENKTLEITEEYEDIHSFVEANLIDRIGDAGKKLHTGRSRNDQVALDMKLYTRDEITHLDSLLRELMEVLLKLMEENTETYMPGFTHLQKAQPITLAHHMGAYFEMFKRDHQRMRDIYKRMNLCPLGSGALAGTTYPLDREYTALLLGFDGPTLNSMDSVSDRDYLIELLSAMSTIMMHLSRFSEEVIIWNTNEYKFVEIDDAYSTGSSIMPQKKNPDIAELVRGKTGRVYGALTSLLTTMKGIPLAYNKDMQEDKELVFDAIDTTKGCLALFTGMLKTMRFNNARMEESAKHGFTNATDAADYLVNHNVPFRDAHGIVGRLVLYCIEKNIALDDMSLEEFKAISPVFEEDIYEAISMKTCVDMRNTIGAPGKNAMEAVIRAERQYLKEQPAL